MNALIPLAIGVVAVADVSNSVVRLMVASVNLASAMVAAKATAYLHRDLMPHLFFIALWSVVTSACMTALAFDQGGTTVVDILNVSAALMIGGWTTFLARIIRRVRHAAQSVGVEPASKGVWVMTQAGVPVEERKAG